MLESEGEEDTKPNEVPEMVECNGNLEIGQKTSDYYKTVNLPKKFEYPVCLKGYGRKEPINPQFMTTSSDYGSIPPTIHTVPKCFYPKTLQFTKHLQNAGMYRNRSLNTALDKSYI
ncbi:piercer of microtubule wall 1 protein [Octopus bimaculoides]|uniref:Uncharacterized protein n=1 Tax=Octopus bimaculoides TaxID=37653 RepID=A0A0L8HFY2_OCTBM|nr:piercer of microtubule wall 1 protein [Octopus bimaculoides]|eukprot:XP_014772613.1 PREDICTED: UPF0691 protein C9orf116 homolog [Octopus bimaculoides]